MSTPDAPRADDSSLVDRLREDLEASAFTVDALEQLLGPVASAALHREQAVPALRATTASDAPSAALLRLLVLGVPVTRAQVDAALPQVGTDGAERLGLVQPAGSARSDVVRPLVDLRPYAAVDGGGPVHWWLASDLGELATGTALRTDHVLGVGGASTLLAQVTIRDERSRALDLGTGCGVQALHLSRHCGAVVATDTSSRALAFARFNGALAGVDLDLRAGSLLDPVAGERFDLLVSNPPFVITPRGASPGPGEPPSGVVGAVPPAGAAPARIGGDAVPRYEYRDGGRSGDDLVRDLVVGAGAALAPGGIAQLLGNWEHRRGDGWTDRVASWLEASGLDGWVVQREVLDPAEYAELWLRDGGTTPDGSPDAWGARYTAWLDDFSARGVEAVGLGLLLLRRPTHGAPTLRRVEERTGPLRQPLGPHLAAVLRANDWLQGLDDDALLSSHMVVAADVTEERHLVPGASDPTVVLLRQGDGFGRTYQAGTALAGLVGACDGELSVGQIAGALATLLEAPTEQVVAELLPQVRELVLDGLLAPA